MLTYRSFQPQIKIIEQSMYTQIHSHDILQSMPIIAIKLINNENISHTTDHRPCGGGILVLHSDRH